MIKDGRGPASGFPFRLLAAERSEGSARTPPFSNVNYQVWLVEYVVSGAGYIEVDGETFRADTDSVYILARGTTHRYWPDRERPWTKIFFVVDGEFADLIFGIHELKGLRYLPDAAPLKRHFEALLELNRDHEGRDRRGAVIVHGFAEECARMRRLAGERLPPEVAALRRHLDNHLEGVFRLCEYAGGSGFSREHLIRRFRDCCGATPYDYLMRKKIEAARSLLAYSSLSVKEIACRLNFSDSCYFSNFFKRKTGMHPGQFRTASRSVAPAEAEQEFLAGR